MSYRENEYLKRARDWEEYEQLRDHPPDNMVRGYRPALSYPQWRESSKFPGCPVVFEKRPAVTTASKGYLLVDIDGDRRFLHKKMGIVEMPSPSFLSLHGDLYAELSKCAAKA